MSWRKSNSTRLGAAIEVCPGRLHLAIIESTGADGACRVRTRSIDWQSETVGPGGLDQQRLSAALTRLVAEEKLRGGKVRIALSPRFCVTRVVCGERERVRQEMEWMSQRSALYLGLGQGPKALATASAARDGRHYHGLLAVTNEKFLKAVMAAAARAGIHIQAMEPSLVALSRLVGSCGGDKDAPQLIVNLADESLELGVSFAGQLLLDYRPAGQQSPADLAALLAKHRTRLVRYCHRQGLPGGDTTGILARVYLSGQPSAVARAQEAIRSVGQSEIEVVELSQLDTRWGLGRVTGSSELAPALGAAVATLSSDPLAGPDFGLEYSATQQDSIWPLAARTCWPMAATLLIALAMMGMNWWGRATCAELAERIEALEPQKAQVWRLQVQIDRAKAKASLLQKLRGQTITLAWDQWLLRVAQCLPDGVWLDQFHADGSGQVKLAGKSYSDEAVYEFVRWLHTVPGAKVVQLEGMQRQQLPSGPGTHFDMRFEVSDRAADNQGGAGDG